MHESFLSDLQFLIICGRQGRKTMTIGKARINAPALPKYALSLILVVILAISCRAANAAKIDCGKSKTNIEKLICDNPVLLDKDDRLAKYFGKIVSTAPKAMATKIRSSQRTWIKSVRDKCEDEECIEKAYSLRQEQLLNESGIPEDVDENDPEDYCIKNGMPPGSALCTSYVISIDQRNDDKKLKEIYSQLLILLPSNSPTYREISQFQDKLLSERDKYCDEYGQSYGAAPSWNAAAGALCRDEMTKSQITVLEDLTSCIKGGKNCHVPSKIELPEPTF